VIHHGAAAADYPAVWRGDFVDVTEIAVVADPLRSGIPFEASPGGISLHLGRVHGLVAVLTAIYVAAAILPWTAIFLSH